MINYIIVDGVDSRKLGLRFDKLPLFPMAEQLVEEYNTGTDETAAYRLEEYNNITITLSAYLVGNTTIFDVYRWLSGAKTIVFSTQPSIYGRIKKVGEIAPKRTGWNAQTITIPLTLSPFKYAVENPEIELENGKYIVNHGTVFSRPVWKLYSITSPVFLNVNGEQLKIDVSSGETVVVDTQKMIAYSGVTIILDKTTGKLPLLSAGNNYVSWTGGVEKITIQKNERWL